MEILTGSGGGGDSVLFARYTGGILSSSTKKSGGGILSGGDFVLHSLIICDLFETLTHVHVWVIGLICRKEVFVYHHEI